MGNQVKHELNQNKMTAVEWLAQMVFNEEDLKDFVLVNVINQAKEMEKEQIIEAVYHTCSAMSHSDIPCGEQYYNQKFKSE